ncbi:MAG: LysR substrate-binding domain-containing protein [Lautropia sp.]
MSLEHVEFRTLQCFVTLAEELNFARAARRLNLSQPPLTKRIQALEEYLQVPLFDRTTRRVSLTAAGTVLLAEARRLFAQSQAMQRAVQQIHQARTGTLRIGFISTTLLAILQTELPRIIAELGSVQYVWSELTSPKQVDAILNDEIDLGFIHTPLDLKGLHDRVLLHERFVIALPSTHPLAKRKSLRLSDIADESLVFFEREIAPEYHERFVDACRAAGFTPMIRHHARHFLSLLMVPASGCGVTVVPASAQNLSVPGVTLVPLRDSNMRAELRLLWNPANRAPALLRVLDAIGPGTRPHAG